MQLALWPLIAFRHLGPSCGTFDLKPPFEQAPEIAGCWTARSNGRR